MCSTAKVKISGLFFTQSYHTTSKDFEYVVWYFYAPPPPILPSFLKLSSCSCIEKNTQPNISICAAQKKENVTSFRWVNAWTIPLKMLSLSKCYTEALQEMFSMQFKLWSYATFLQHPTSQIWRGQHPALTLKSSQVSIIRGVHYLLHLLLKGIFNWKEKCRGGNESGIFHSFSSSLHTHSLFNLFSPQHREQGSTSTVRCGWMCLCLCSQSLCGVTGIFESASTLGRAGKDGERKTCWQALHRQLQTSGRPGESVLNLCQRKGEKKTGWWNRVKLIYAQMHTSLPLRLHIKSI